MNKYRIMQWHLRRQAPKSFRPRAHDAAGRRGADAGSSGGCAVNRSNAETKDTHLLGHPTVGQDVTVLFATRIGLAAFTLLAQGLLAWILLPEGRGSYAVCVAFTTVLGLFLAPGVQQGTQYFVAAGRASISQGVSCALTLGLIGAALAAVLAIPLIGSDTALFDKAATHSFYLALPLIPLTVISTAIDYQFVALRRFKRLAVFSLLRVGVNALAILPLARGFGVDGALLALAASHLVMITVGLRDLRRHCGLVAETPSWSLLGGVFGYGMRHHLGRIVEAIGPQPSILVLGLLASAADVGLFAVASTLIFGFCLISGATGCAILPRIAVKESPELVAMAVRLVLGATVCALIVVLAFASPLIRFLFSEFFLPVVVLLWILAPGILAHVVGEIFGTHFKAVNRPDICSWAGSLGLCVNLTVLALLHPALGVEAAAWAMTTGMLCSCAFLVIVFQRTTRTRWFRIWLPRREDARFLRDIGRFMLALVITLGHRGSPVRGRGWERVLPPDRTEVLAEQIRRARQGRPATAP